MKVPDEFLQMDAYALFPQPLYFRLPSNTDEVLNNLLSNPTGFVNYELSVPYVALRRGDLYNDMNAIKEQGSNSENMMKYCYYKGIVSALDFLLLNPETDGTTKVSIQYIALWRNEIYGLMLAGRAEGSDFDNVMEYCYNKGMVDICDQLLLNTAIEELP